jgi:alpha-tubulin suppressor-like RCC1 family protein
LLAVAVWFCATGCLDPTVPGAGTPTLDDPVIGSASAVTVGRAHTCALNSAGDAFCWGSNEFGQLGSAIGATVCAREDRHIPCERSPRAVAGGLKFQRLAAGGGHTCGIAQNGRVYCWGDNQYGQLGDPAMAATATPIAALSTALFSEIVAGGAHTCALRTDAVVICWGSNDFGQLGIATAGTGSVVPVAAQTNLRFASVSAGEKRTCGRLSDGTSYCWGAQWVSRSSDGTEAYRPQAQPARVLSAPAFRQLSVGGQATCALALDGAPWCWESNPTGAMGDGSTAGSVFPVQVNTNVRFTSISSGSRSACGIADSGEMYCWGAGLSGQLAIPASSAAKRCSPAALPCELSPNKATGWRVFAALAAGLGDHVCGLTLNGSVYCWGAGAMGQRGDGSAHSYWSPTRVPIP